MESKDNLNKIKYYYNNCAENSPTPTELKWFNTIEKDLDRLEKQDKAIEIIKNNRGINFFNVFSFLSLPKEEQDLIKEVLKDEKM